ncbi:MAG: hypothetical protein ACREXO_23125 [Advenella sp.]
MLTDAKLRNRQSKYTRYKASDCHGPGIGNDVGIYVDVCITCDATATTRDITPPKIRYAIHSRRHTAPHPSIPNITGRNTSPNITNRYVQYRERPEHPDIFHHTPRNHQGYTPYHPPAQQGDPGHGSEQWAIQFLDYYHGRRALPASI